MFLPLFYLKLLAADAKDIILPSDHFIFLSHRFRRRLNSAVNALTIHPHQLILLGVRPNTPEAEYGWIQSSALVRKNRQNSLYQVKSFFEKPAAFNA